MSNKCNVCVQKISENENYCFQHQKSCQENDCLNRIVSWAIYCCEHQNLHSRCLFENCHAILVRDKSYRVIHEGIQINRSEENSSASNFHLGICSRCGLLSYGGTPFLISDNDWSTIEHEQENNYSVKSTYNSSSHPLFTHCPEHRKYCQFNNCSRAINYNSEGCRFCFLYFRRDEEIGIQRDEIKYCSYHQFKCKERDCLARIKNRLYCSNHTNLCKELICFERISVEESYCSNHNKYCQHSSCYNRIASYQSSCFDCQEKNQLKTLVKQRTNIADDIQEVERFTTWWNNNLATVIVYDNSHYRVFLLVYVKEDNSVKVFPHDGSSNYWGEHSRKQHNCLSDAKSETSWLRNELSKGYGKYHDHPILLIHPYCDCSRSFDSFVCEPYVVKNYNLSKAKVGDILWVEKVIFGKSVLGWKKYYHSGIYIGSNEVIDYTNQLGILDSLVNDYEFTSGRVSQKNGITRKVSLSTFLENRDGELYAEHAIIPFVHINKIIQRLVWAKDNGFWKGDYNLANKNCQHFVNGVARNIFYSLEVEEKKGRLIARDLTAPARTVGGIAGGARLFNFSTFYFWN